MRPLRGGLPLRSSELGDGTAERVRPETGGCGGRPLRRLWRLPHRLPLQGPRKKLRGQARHIEINLKPEVHGPDPSTPFYGFRVRKLIPTVPNLSALDACSAPANTSAFQTISKSVKPAETTVASSSASSRAPPIQPVRRSILCFALSGTSRFTRRSPICNLPPGRNTLNIFLRTLALSDARFKTPLEITTPAPRREGTFLPCRRREVQRC